MSIIYRGNTAFDVLDEPRLSKNEWGTDVLSVTYAGRKPLLPIYLATLRQGKSVVYASTTFYLQTWEDDGGRVFPRVTLSYKGFRNGIPDADGENDTGTKVATMSAKINNESVAKLIAGTPVTPGPDGDYVVHATREVVFVCPQTRWRYITSSKPAGASYNVLNTTTIPRILRSRITAKYKDKEIIFAGNAPAALVSALSMTSQAVTDSHSSTHIIGTPYWECVDTVSGEFIGDTF